MSDNTRLTPEHVAMVRASTGSAEPIAHALGVSATTIRSVRRGLVRRNG
jgi:hypothetical protein